MTGAKEHARAAESVSHAGGRPSGHTATAKTDAPEANAPDADYDANAEAREPTDDDLPDDPSNDIDRTPTDKSGDETQRNEETSTQEGVEHRPHARREGLDAEFPDASEPNAPSSDDAAA